MVVLAAKILAVILAFMVVRWSWPRFRFDQLMSLAWKVMVPLGLVNLVVTAVLVEYRDEISQIDRHRQFAGSHHYQLGSYAGRLGCGGDCWRRWRPITRPRLAVHRQFDAEKACLST